MCADVVRFCFSTLFEAWHWRVDSAFFVGVAGLDRLCSIVAAVVVWVAFCVYILHSKSSLLSFALIVQCLSPNLKFCALYHKYAVRYYDFYQQ